MRVFCIFAAILLSAAAHSKSCDQIKVSGSDQWIPFAYSEGEGLDKKPVGIAYDIVNMIGKDLGVPIKIHVGIPWARIEAMLDRGDLDLLAGNYWNEERAKKWLITNDFGEDEVRVFVNKGGEFTFRSLHDLKSKRGIMPFGISFGQKFDAFKKNLILEAVQLHDQMIRMLRFDRAEYIILPLYSGTRKIKSLGYQDNIVALERPVNVNKVHLSLSKLSPCAGLLDRINEIIERRKQDGSFEAAFANYL